MTDSGTVTIAFTDLVGSTELLARLGDELAEELTRWHFEVVRGAAVAHRGRVVKSLGDGLMLAFPGASDAPASAKAMQEATERHNAAWPAKRLGVRIGIGVGEPRREGEDYFGTPVVVAARLCDAAAGGQVLVCDVVRSLVAGRGGLQFRDLGALALKGLPAPVPASELLWREPDPRSRIRLSGRLQVEIDGRDVTGELVGGRSRAVVLRASEKADSRWNMWGSCPSADARFTFRERMSAPPSCSSRASRSRWTGARCCSRC